MIDKVPTVGVVFNPILDEVRTSDMQYVGCTCKKICQTRSGVSKCSKVSGIWSNSSNLWLKNCWNLCIVACLWVVLHVQLFTAVKGRGAFLNGQHIYGQ